MPGRVHRLADRADVARHPGRRLVVDNHQRAIRIGLTVGLEPPLDLSRQYCLAPAQRHFVDLKPEFAGDHRQPATENPVVEHQHAVAGRQCIDQRGLSRPSTGCRVEHRCTVVCAEDTPQSNPDILSQFGEFRAAVVDNRPVHRP